MRRPFIAIGAAAGLLAACTSGSSSSSSTAASSAPATSAAASTSAAAATTAAPAGSSAPTTAAAATTTTEAITGPAPGVTDTEIKLGVTFVDTKALKTITVDAGDFEGVYKALIADVNAKGGINGRKLSAVFAPIDPQTNVASDAACVKMTEDDKVFAVLGFFLGDTVTCTMGTHKTFTIGGDFSQERLKQATAPWYTPNPGASVQASALQQMVDKGLLGGKVAVVSIATDSSQVNDTVLPILTKAGVKPVTVAAIDAPADDPAAVDAAVSANAQRVEAAGADTVLIFGQAANNWLQTMQNKPYRPKLLLTDYNGTQAFVANAAHNDLSALKDAVVGGAFGPEARIWDEPKMQACEAIVKAAGVKATPPAESTDEKDRTYFAVFEGCKVMSVFTAMVERTGKNLNYNSLQAAVKADGKIDVPGNPNPYTFSAEHPDGNPSGFLYQVDIDKRALVLAS